MSNYLTRPVVVGVPVCADEACLFRGEPLAFIGGGFEDCEGPVADGPLGPAPYFPFCEFGCHWCGAHLKVRAHQFDYDAYQFDRDIIRCEWCLDPITNTDREDDEEYDGPDRDYYLTKKGPACELPS